MATHDYLSIEHKFKVGQAVHYYPRRPHFAPYGLYLVTAALPKVEGEFHYRIKNIAEPHQRAARESELCEPSQVSVLDFAERVSRL
jgi:hypothetical protein